MLKRDIFPQEILSAVSDGLKGELELLRYEYEKRAAALLVCIRQLIAAVPAEQAFSQWQQALIASREGMLQGFAECVSLVEDMETKVREGRLALLSEKVCSDVSQAEEAVLSRLTALQRINSAALQNIFALSLSSKIKELSKDEASLLRSAIAAQTENTQFFSNELQEFAIVMKERNKTITHPLDENHPE